MASNRTTAYLTAEAAEALAALVEGIGIPMSAIVGLAVHRMHRKPPRAGVAGSWPAGTTPVPFRPSDVTLAKLRGLEEITGANASRVVSAALVALRKAELD